MSAAGSCASMLATGADSDIPFRVQEQLPIGPRHAPGGAPGDRPGALTHHPDPGSLARRPLASRSPRSAPSTACASTGARTPCASPTGSSPAGRPTASASRSCAGMRARRARYGRSLRGEARCGRSATCRPITPRPSTTPDGRAIVALRSSNALRMHSYMEYGALRHCELVRLPAASAHGTCSGRPAARARVVTAGSHGRHAAFLARTRPRSTSLFSDGVHARRARWLGRLPARRGHRSQLVFRAKAAHRRTTCG